MSEPELVERYKDLSAKLVGLDADMSVLKKEREGVCKQLLATDGKGHVYDLGDGMPMVITTTKVGTHYMAPKNKWMKAGKVPKPPKAPKVAKAPKPAAEAAEPKPLTRRAIVGGKIVEMPVERNPSSPPPPVEVQTPQSSAAPTLVPDAGVQKQPEVVERVVTPKAPAKPPAEPEVDPLAAALAALDPSDLE